MNEYLYLQAIRENLESNDLQGMIDAYLEMRAFAREVFEVALARGDSLGFSSDEDLVERWEQLTGEVYGEDCCIRE